MNTRRILSFIAVASCASALFGADLYVSHLKDGDGNPYYEGAPDGAAVYADLQTAISAKATKDGDTVWIENGFLCDSGSTENHGPSRIVISKKLTIRSRSGDWRTGAEIRGAWHDETTMKGKNAVRCVALGHGSEATFIGLRFTRGSISGSGDARYGGAVKTCGLETHIKATRLEKCLVAECYGTCLYSQNGVPMTVVDCVMTNNSTGVALGASLYDCRVEDNYGMGSYTVGTAGDDPAKCNVIVVSNCVIRNNRTDNSNSTAGLFAPGTACLSVYDTKITGNVNGHNVGGGAGVRGYGSYVRCEISGNVCPRSGNAAIYSSALGGVVLNDCIVTNNLAGGGYGGAGEQFVATNTLFAYNMTSQNCAGVKSAHLYNCRIIGNRLVAMEASERQGGGAHSCVLEKCFLADNVCTNNGTGTTNAGYGGGAYKSTLVDCVVSNCAAGSGGGVYSCALVNTSVVDCQALFDGGGIYGGAATNCLVCGNFAGKNRTENLNQGNGGGTCSSLLANCVISNNTCVYRGGGVFGDDTRNCLICDNRQIGSGSGFGSVNHGGGSGCWDGVYYNCLIVRNTSVAEYGSPIAYYKKHFPYYNCTVTDNTSTGAYSHPGSFNCQAVNSVIAGNISTAVGAVDTYNWASNSIVTVETGTYGRKLEDMGCVVTNDPKLETLDGVAYVPKQHSPCKDQALVFDWMSDPNDIRSKDLAGKDRILGAGPDIGCHERKGKGLQLMVR